MLRKTLIVTMIIFIIFLFILVENAAFLRIFEILTYAYDTEYALSSFMFIFVVFPILSFLLAMFMIFIERGFSFGKLKINKFFIVISLICDFFYAIIFLPAFIITIEWPAFFYTISRIFYHDATISMLIMVTSLISNFFLIKGFSSK